jgi:hypothetical protein
MCDDHDFAAFAASHRPCDLCARILSFAEEQNMKNMKSYGTYPLRLPRSIKAEVERLAKQDGISINQFIAAAVAEKLSAMRTADFLPNAGRAPILPNSTG